MTDMTESDRLALVAIAVARGASVEAAWSAVDSITTTDLRAASLEIDRLARENAWSVYA